MDALLAWEPRVDAKVPEEAELGFDSIALLMKLGVFTKTLCYPREGKLDHFRDPRSEEHVLGYKATQLREVRT